MIVLCYRTDDKKPYPMEPLCLAMGEDIYKCWYTHGYVICTGISLLVVTLFEVFEVIRTRLSYFKQFENYFSMSMIISTTTFIFLAPHKMELANHVGAWAVVLVWLKISQQLGRFDFFGLGIFMGLHVAKKIIKTIFIFAPSFLAFIFGFNMLFRANPAFHSVISSAIKVFVMMTGEFNFDENFGYRAVHDLGGRNFSIQV